MAVTGVILAGGKSSRMGVNKALLRINNIPAIQRIKDSLEGVVRDIIVVSNEQDIYDFLGIPVIEDLVKNKGPLAGIHTGLRVSSTKWNLFIACDMPLVSVESTEILVNLAEKHKVDAVIPKIADRVHPLYAVYHSSILPIVEDCLANDELRMKSLLEKLKVYEVTEQEFALLGLKEEMLNRAFFNMNRPEDYQKVMEQFDER